MCCPECDVHLFGVRPGKAIVNGDLEETFRGWYPAFRHNAEWLAA
jgi:hypothetical protein